MTLITAVTAALKQRNPRTNLTRLEELLHIHMGEGLPPLCVIGEVFPHRGSVLTQIVTQEMHVLHALARKDIDTILKYLENCAPEYASPAGLDRDSPLPFVWYARAHAKKIKEEPTLDKWDWLSKVIQRNLLEDRCPSPSGIYDPRALVHVHIAEKVSEVNNHLTPQGVYVYATPERIYIVTPIEREDYPNHALRSDIGTYVRDRKGPTLIMGTMYVEDQKRYDINVRRGAHPLYEATLATTLNGKFELKGVAPISEEAKGASLIPPTKISEAIFFFTFDVTGKGTYDYRQPQLPFSVASVLIINDDSVTKS